MGFCNTSPTFAAFVLRWGQRRPELGLPLEVDPAALNEVRIFLQAHEALERWSLKESKGRECEERNPYGARELS